MFSNHLSSSDAYSTAMDDGDVLGATDAYDTQSQADRNSTLGWAVAGGAFVGAGVGAVVTIRFGRQGSDEL